MLPPDKSHNVNNGFKGRIKTTSPALWGMVKIRDQHLKMKVTGVKYIR